TRPIAARSATPTASIPARSSTSPPPGPEGAGTSLPAALPADPIRGPLTANAAVSAARQPAHGSCPWAAAVGLKSPGANARRFSTSHPEGSAELPLPPALFNGPLERQHQPALPPPCGSAEEGVPRLMHRTLRSPSDAPSPQGGGKQKSRWQTPAPKRQTF